jgi:hypothetical protein
MALAPIPPADLKDFRKDGSQAYRSQSLEPLQSWEAALRAALVAHTPDQAATLLAPRFGMSRARMRQLVYAWIPAVVHAYESDERRKSALRRGLLDLLAGPDREPLTIEAAAEALDGLSDCDADDFAALMRGSVEPARDAWLIASAASCGGNFTRAALAAPDRSTPVLIRLGGWGSLSTRASLVLAEWLASPAVEARMAEAGRPEMHAMLVARYVDLLFQTGLTSRAVSLIDSLPPEQRRRVIDPAPRRFAATIDGIAVPVDEKGDASIALNLAAAYALAGRNQEADAVLAMIPSLPAARRALACTLGTESHAQCDQPNDGSMSALLIEQLLDHAGEDAYPLAESFHSGGSLRNLDSPVLAELNCRIFAEPRFRTICADARDSAAAKAREIGKIDEEGAEGEAALAKLLAGFIPARDRFEAEIRAGFRDTPPPAERPQRVSIDPASSPFPELLLPALYAGARPPETAIPKRIASALPEGFAPVRFEQSGQRVAVISLSHGYDPTGEVSQGGYWLHLSEDGGAHWEKPLYTGLADRFPYVVPASSRMPMIDGDAINLEVEVNQIDTATITYPPVGLRPRRHASGLYLRLPLDRLRGDSDHDGISDIAAHHLLLDHARTDGGTPFVVGSDHDADCATDSPDRGLQVAILARVLGVRDGAIVEPLGRKPGQIIGEHGSGAAADRPIFVEGAPADYRCLHPDRKIIVYGPDDLIALRRFTPDFHALTMPAIIFNRAHDRGYFRWSLGWTGGTYRVRRVNGAWQFDPISSWIT